MKIKFKTKKLKYLSENLEIKENEILIFDYKKYLRPEIDRFGNDDYAKEENLKHQDRVLFFKYGNKKHGNNPQTLKDRIFIKLTNGKISEFLYPTNCFLRYED